MIEQDTIRLLRECDAGVKMGMASIEDVLPHTRSEELRTLLEECREDHRALDRRLQGLLDKYHDEGKDPNPVAKGMSWVKTNVMMAVKDSDAAIADLMTDGCNMGAKSLRKYLNEFEAADQTSKDIAKDLIDLEEELIQDLREYL